MKATSALHNLQLEVVSGQGPAKDGHHERVYVGHIRPTAVKTILLGHVPDVYGTGGHFDSIEDQGRNSLLWLVKIFDNYFHLSIAQLNH